jgi:N-acetylmuramoyl-L-alanine amidase
MVDYTVIDRRNSVMPAKNRRSVNDIKKEVLHYSATKAGSAQAFNRHWVSLGWHSAGGYAKIVLTNGNVELCYNPTERTNGARNQNAGSYHICYVGDGEPNSRQRPVLIALFREKMEEFKLSASDVVGHRELPGQSTLCPRVNLNTFRRDVENFRSSQKGEKIPMHKDALKYGDNGSAVKRLQEMLLEVGEVLPRFGSDGDFGSETEAAVQSFQEKHGISTPNGNYYGVAGPLTFSTLEDLLQQETASNSLKRGDKGDAVKHLQNMLLKAGMSLPRFGSDGDFGNETEAAVKAFQKNYGISGSSGRFFGTAGPATMEKLEEVTELKGESFRKGDSGDGVERLQRLLLNAGMSLPRFGNDGDFGNETEAAVQEFQLIHGISNGKGNFFGVAGPMTLQALLKQ